MQSRLASLYTELCDLDAGARASYYETHSVEPELCAELESLLAHESTRSDEFEALVADAAAEFLNAPAEAAPGARCGPYKLIRLLGRGGMGAVFLAGRADGEVEQLTAIKFMRGGGERFRSRFLRERQILASLNHPGIARLFDAGKTESGQPYLVMEYIEGQPIDVYCEQLGWREILRLFLPVCDAVMYAHRKLVIHCDLKPSNIMVEPGGRPKLLDFGIARMLDSQRGLTRECILTPEYASPEQTRGEAKSTATDIYSLGAILRKLLERADAPPADLKYILAAAMRPEPEERYESADALGADVAALLQSRPVKARAGNAWYRSRKFLSRHWLAAAVAAAAVLGLSASAWMANRQRDIAQARLSQVRQAADRFLRLETALEYLPGTTKAREEAIATSNEYLESLSRDSHGDPVLEMELASGYQKLGRVLGVPAYPNLGKYADAMRSLAKGDALVDDILARSPVDVKALSLAAEIEAERMMVADTEGDHNASLAQARRCAQRADALRASGHASSQQMRDIGRYYSNVGLAFQNAHQFDEAVDYVRRAVEVAHSNGDPRVEASSESLLANILRQTGDLPGALEAITGARRLIGAYRFRNNIGRTETLYPILWRQGLILGDADSISLGRADEALAPLQEILDMLEAESSSDPNDALGRFRFATVAQTMGNILAEHSPAKSLEIFDRGSARLGETAPSIRTRRDEARLQASASYPLRELGRASEASQRIARALALLRETNDLPAETIEPGRDTEIVLRAKADQAAGTGYTRGAIEQYEELLNKSAKYASGQSDLMLAVNLSRLYRNLGALYRRNARTADAAALRERRMKLWDGWNQKLPNNKFVAAQMRAAAAEYAPLRPQRDNFDF